MKGRCRSTILEDTEGSDEQGLGSWKLEAGWRKVDQEGFEFLLLGNMRVKR